MNAWWARSHPSWSSQVLSCGSQQGSVPQGATCLAGSGYGPAVCLQWMGRGQALPHPQRWGRSVRLCCERWGTLDSERSSVCASWNLTFCLTSTCLLWQVREEGQQKGDGRSHIVRGGNVNVTCLYISAVRNEKNSAIGHPLLRRVHTLMVPHPSLVSGYTTNQNTTRWKTT